MGRLFWKFFFSFWLILLTAAIGAGSFVWIKHSADNNTQSGDVRLIDFRGEPYVQVAADIARSRGRDGLSRFLQQIQTDKLMNIMAVNRDDQDMLGRPVNLQALNQARQLLTGGKRQFVKRIRIDNQHWLLYAPLSEPKKAPGPLRKKGWILKHLPLVLIITSAILASLLFSGLLAWYFTRPIKHLKQAFQSLAEGQLETRVAPKMYHRRDELAELGEHFDIMAAQIGRLINGQRQLLHDVSHELRSPLARIQAAIGIAQQQPDKVSHTLSRLEKEAERMSDLVGELLLLSRMETGVNHNKPVDFDINMLLEDIVADARFEAEAKAVHLDYQQSEPVNLYGQQELLHRAVENVLRNAIKFSDAGDTVQLHTHLNADKGQYHIVIEDEGPGVPETELDKLFRPFFRGSAQRRDGIGLGLTIAQRAVAAHGGSIEATNRPQGGLQIHISLPLHRP